MSPGELLRTSCRSGEHVHTAEHTVQVTANNKGLNTDPDSGGEYRGKYCTVYPVVDSTGLKRDPDNGREYRGKYLFSRQAEAGMYRRSEYTYYTTYTVSAVKTETSEPKNVSNIFFFSENILSNTIEYI